MDQIKTAWRFKGAVIYGSDDDFPSFFEHILISTFEKTDFSYTYSIQCNDFNIPTDVFKKYLEDNHFMDVKSVGSWVSFRVPESWIKMKNN